MRSYLVSAYVIGHTKGMDAMFDDEILLRRIRKSGDYHGVLLNVVMTSISLKPSHVSGGLNAIEVSPVLYSALDFIGS